MSNSDELSDEQVSKGGCLCGAVRYEVRGALRDVVNCHCGMCRRLHGAFGPHSKAHKRNLRIYNDEGLAWYAGSDVARRGFCSRCGSSLFWEPFDQEGIGIVAGSLDDSRSLKTMGHIFVADKAQFYEIQDELPQFPASSEGAFEGDYR